MCTYYQSYRELGNDNGWEMYNDIVSFQWEVLDPGVKMHCLYGTGINTIALYV